MSLQTYAASVTRITDLTDDVREIELSLLNPPVIGFKPGQFISFEVPKKGFPLAAVRPYSIVSPPSQRDRLTVVLNLVPGGPGSTFLFSLREGDQTTFKGPAGSFYLKDDATRDFLLFSKKS